MRRAIVFDVLETLLDLSALDPIFAEELGDAAARREWFAQLLGLVLTTGVIGEWYPFAELSAHALRAVAARRGVVPRDGAAARVDGAMAFLPPYPEVPDALAALRAQGYALYALSNGKTATVQSQLGNARLIELFDEVYGADKTEQYKPSAEVYRNALVFFGVEREDALYVAAHDWDCAGAARFGLPTAFVAREGRPLAVPQPAPRIIAADLAGVAEQIRFFPVTVGAA